MKRINPIIISIVFTTFFSAMPSLYARQNIRVGVYDFEPIVFMDEQHRANGLYIDVLNHIAEKEHWNIEYVPGTWQECLDRLERGEIDIQAAITYTEERTAKFDFTKTYLYLDWGVVYKKRGSPIRTIFDLQGKTVSILKSSLTAADFKKLLTQFGISCQLIEKNEYSEVFESLSIGESEAGVSRNLYGTSIEGKYSTERTVIIFSPAKISFAAKKGMHGDILNTIDKYSDMLKADEHSLYYKFYDKWLGTDKRFPVWFWGAGISVIGIAILCFLFIVILKRQVRLKISELASANELLKHSEEHFRLAFENAYIGVCLVSTDGRILSVNQRMCEIFGYSKQEFEGMSVNTITHPDYRDISPTFIKKAASGEIAHAEFEKQYIHKQGNIIWGKVSSSIIRDNQGKPLYFISYVQDITDRKLIEEVQSFLLRYDYLAAGETFFRSLARYLAEKLEADFVCIDRLEDSNLSARTVAVWHDGKFEDNVTYTLKDTPCGDVVGKTICSYPEGVCYLFPKDEVLQQMNAESYVGTTLWSSEGQPIGLIALIWRNPITNQQIAETILKLVAVRAAGELERKQAEDVLRKNEKKLSKVFQTSPAIITITTISEGRFLEVNKAFLNLFGYTRQEVIGKTSSELNLWEDITIRNNAVASLYAQKKDLLFEAAFRKKNTDLFYGLISLTPIEMNGVDCILSTGVDITERKQAEEQFKTIFDMALDMICIADLDRAAFTKINPAFTRTLGYSEKELTDRSFLDFVHPDDVEKTMAVIENELKKGTDILSFENRYRCKNGSYRYLIWNAHPIPEKNITFAVAHDITDRKKAEEALWKSIWEYRSLFENMISGFAYHQMIFDENNKPTDYIFLEINSAFEKHTGLTREIIGKRVTEIHPEIKNYNPDFISIYGEVALTGKATRFDVYFEPQQHWYTISAYSPQKGYFAAVFDDITDRRNTEKKLRRKSEELATVLDAMPALVWIAPDPECRVITGNRAVNELLGISEGTNVSQTAAESGKALRIRHLKPDGTELRAEELPIQRAIALGQPVFNQEFTYDLSDRRQISALGNAVPLFDENGDVRGAVGVFWDITERKRAEDELNRFFNLVPDMVCIASADGYFIKLNKEWERVLGYSEEELLAVPLADFIHPDDHEATFREMEKQIAGNATLNFINRYRTKNGGYRWFEWNATPSVEEKFLFAAARDITERRRAEEALYTRLNLREYADSHTLDELLQYTLDKAEQLTGSQIGFFHFLSADQKILTLQMWSGNTLKNMCTAEGKGAHYPVEKAGIWADCVRQQKPVIHNDYSSLPHRKGMPEGHAPVIRELTLPVIRGNRIAAIIGIGNKLSDYTETDVRVVSELADMSWDIISNKLAEDALKRSEERYRKAQTLGKVGNWEYNIRTAHFWGSDEAKRIYGFAPDSEHFTTEEVENCIPEREKVHQALVDLIEKDAEYNLEFDIVTYNTGDRKTIISIAQLERDSNGHPLKITGVIHDITDRKITEERLRKSEEQYRLIIETAMEGIWLIDLQGKTLFINQRMADMLGYTVEEIQTADVFQFLDPHQHREARVSLERRRDGIGEIVERCFIRKDGSVLWTLNSITPIRDSQGKVIGSMGMLSDITERRQAEAEKAKLESRLRQAQSMEAIGTLAGGIAHDFNNILFPIIGYTEMTTDDLPEGSRAHQNLREVLKAAIRAKELVNQILTFSRQQENEKIILKIQPVVKEALKLIRSTLPTTIELSQNIDPNCNPVLADPTQIHQIIMNLCTNAYHAMQDHGGVLEVILTEVKLGQYDLTAYPGSLPGTYLKLSVSDTGIGMAKEMLERIFDPFFTTKPVGKGTGLGLSVVHGIVKQMGGHVRVYSEPGKGTAFHVYMPVLETESISDQKPAVSDEFIPTGSERILLTDDEVPILNMLGQMLEELGYRVSSYADSSDAFNAFEKMPDSFDLLITDMTMPNMTGAQLAKKILEIRADMPIILCTGFSEQINGAKSEKFGIKGYLMKPVIRSEMAKMIRKVLGKVRNEKASGTRNQ